MEPVQPGRIIQRSAQRENDISEALRAEANRRFETATQPAFGNLGPNEVFVRCMSGSPAVPRHTLGWIQNTTTAPYAGAEDTVIITDANNPDEYQRHPVFRWSYNFASTFPGESYQKEWPTMGAVIQQPLKTNQIGRAKIAGPAVVNMAKTAGNNYLAGAHELQWVYSFKNLKAFKAPFGFKCLSAADANGQGWINLSQTNWKTFGVIEDNGINPRVGDSPGQTQGTFVWVTDAKKFRRYGHPTLGTYSAIFHRWTASDANYAWLDQTTGLHAAYKGDNSKGARLAPVQLMTDGRWWVMNWDPFDRAAFSNFPQNESAPILDEPAV